LHATDNRTVHHSQYQTKRSCKCLVATASSVMYGNSRPDQITGECANGNVADCVGDASSNRDVKHFPDFHRLDSRAGRNGSVLRLCYCPAATCTALQKAGRILANGCDNHMTNGWTADVKGFSYEFMPMASIFSIPSRWRLCYCETWQI